ncbi:uncharacterized protein [Nicotiana sylvestris]|uniref:uncharacterized protein n=1 Tax=Nicotiana sylvestris TaxID=4096 RepID=UPI00388C73CB
MGDFSAVLQPDNRMGGSAIQHVKVKDFEEFLGSAGLIVMKTVGIFYSWTNSHIHSRIDRDLVSPTWMSLWPQIADEAKDPYFFDCSMLCITFSRSPRKVARPFRFFNHLTAHTELLNIVSTMWNWTVQREYMEQVWHQLKLMNEGIKALKRACVLIAQNHINRLTTTSGDVVHIDRAVEAEIIGFYKGLLGTYATQLPAIIPSILVASPILDNKQKLSLIAPVTREEIYLDLKDISDLKTPGYDRFNACFFKKLWPIIRDDVSDVVI